MFAAGLQAQGDKPWQFPEALRPQLDARLRAFTEAQASGDWNAVERLLGTYRRGGQYLPYTPSHRACLVDAMKQFPMIRFHYTVLDKSFSDEILSTPPERRWWTLGGDATFRHDAREVTKQIYLVAYRDQGDWYFTPPPLDNVSAASHFTSEQLANDLADRVILRVYPSSPIEIADLHVFVDKDNVLSRHIRFRLRNLTRKRITGYEFEISDENKSGSISEGTGAERDWIEPSGMSHEFTEDYAVSTYWCEGNPRIIFEVENAQFQDGTSWEAPLKTNGAHSH